MERRDMIMENNKVKQEKYCNVKDFKRLIKICIYFMTMVCCIIIPMKSAVASDQSGGELHAFYPSNALFGEQVKKYIDDVDSLSFAWGRIDSYDPGTVNTVKGKNGNNSFYYPADFIQPVEYAKSQGKSIQLNIYMDKSDCIKLLPYEDKRAAMIKAITNNMEADISQGNGIYYDGVVIDFEGLRNTDGSNTQILYEGKPISTYFIKFLSELKAKLKPLAKKMYVAVNPGLYYDGYDYANIMHVADRVILMAHDYEPTEKLQKNQVQQYTGYNALEPINSMAPIQMVRQALNEIKGAASDSAELSKVWLQITFDSAQWQFDVKSAKAWESIDNTSLSREGRSIPLYKSIKARIDNTDGNGSYITYGYNNELQTPYIQYYNTPDKSWNIILYEDSNSIGAKIDLAKSYGLGGISLWSLSNVPDYTDPIDLKFHLDGWSTILDKMNSYDKQPIRSREYVKFTDSSVEQAVRKKLGKPTEAITKFDLQRIYRLKLPQGVTKLVDLKYLTNLEYLDAQKLGIKDITVITKLKKLRVLYLQRNNISDISALKKLTKLEVLSLNGNKITDLKSLSKLTTLEKLYLKENKITSVTLLKGLTNLKELYLGGNKITDYSPINKLSQNIDSRDYRIK